MEVIRVKIHRSIANNNLKYVRRIGGGEKSLEKYCDIYCSSDSVN